MIEEANKLCSMLETEVGHTEVNEFGEKLVDLSLRMNISIVNALWVLLVGEKLDLKDEKLARIVQVWQELDWLSFLQSS